MALTRPPTLHIGSLNELGAVLWRVDPLLPHLLRLILHGPARLLVRRHDQRLVHLTAGRHWISVASIVVCCFRDHLITVTCNLWQFLFLHVRARPVSNLLEGLVWLVFEIIGADMRIGGTAELISTQAPLLLLRFGSELVWLVPVIYLVYLAEAPLDIRATHHQVFSRILHTIQKPRVI